MTKTDTTRHRPMPHLPRASTTALFAIVLGFAILPVHAQDFPAGWETNVDIPQPGTPSAQPGNTTIVPQTDSPELLTPDTPAQTATKTGKLKLVALLTADGQKIDRGIVWRIYEDGDKPVTQRQLVETNRDASPLIKLKPGKYVINAAFGRAHLTRSIEVTPSTATIEQFVLNAGGLKLSALISGKKAPKNSVSYDILEGEPDQSGVRALVTANARPQLIIRLNAGIYHVISHYGDANATVNTDIQVEAGKLTLVTISHEFAMVTFKLVERADGEALPGTQWSIATSTGEIVKTSVGALPTHILAPGKYLATAKRKDVKYQQEFDVKDGQTVSVEVLMQ